MSFRASRSVLSGGNVRERSEVTELHYVQSGKEWANVLLDSLFRISMRTAYNIEVTRALPAVQFIRLLYIPSVDM